VKNFMKRAEVTLATSLSGDAIVTRAEAARLKNENLSLRKELEERTLKAKQLLEKSDKPDGRASTSTDNSKKNRKSRNRSPTH
jgi:hypothetical protein